MSSFSFNPEGYYLERKTKDQKLENNFYETVSKIGELRKVYANFAQNSFMELILI